ncbi:MAG: ADP-ribosylation factor-like protein [Candidatus Hodarchaeales archaeon]|jgi:small GTP-binding protein
MEETQIVFVGLTGSGKTTLLTRLVSGEFRAVPRTMGFAADEFDYDDKIRVRAIDLGGQDPFIHSFWKDFIPQADVIIFMIDAAAHSLMKKVRDTLLTVISWIEEKQPIVLILANKQDLPDAYSFGDVIALLNLTEVAEMPVEALQIFGTSAKTGHGVSDAFDWLVCRITGSDTFPRAHIYQNYVYEAPGVLVGSSIFRSFVSPMEGIESGVDPVLATSFYTTLSRIVKEFADSGLDPEHLTTEEHILKNPHSNSPDLVIHHFVNKERKLASLVVAEEGDNLRAVRAVAESALAITQAWRTLHPYEVMPENILKQHIAPFVVLDEGEEKAIANNTPKRPVPLKAVASKEAAGLPITNSSESVMGQSFDFTFFTKLSALDRAKNSEGNHLLE